MFRLLSNVLIIYPSWFFLILCPHDSFLQFLHYDFHYNFSIRFFIIIYLWWFFTIIFPSWNIGSVRSRVQILCQGNKSFHEITFLHFPPYCLTLYITTLSQHGSLIIQCIWTRPLCCVRSMDRITWIVF